MGIETTGKRRTVSLCARQSAPPRSARCACLVPGVRPRATSCRHRQSGTVAGLHLLCDRVPASSRYTAIGKPLLSIRLPGSRIWRRSPCLAFVQESLVLRPGVAFCRRTVASIEAVSLTVPSVHLPREIRRHRNTTVVIDLRPITATQLGQLSCPTNRSHCGCLASACGCHSRSVLDAHELLHLGHRVNSRWPFRSRRRSLMISIPFARMSMRVGDLTRYKLTSNGYRFLPGSGRSALTWLSLSFSSRSHSSGIVLSATDHAGDTSPHKTSGSSDRLRLAVAEDEPDLRIRTL